MSDNNSDEVILDNTLENDADLFDENCVCIQYKLMEISLNQSDNNHLISFENELSVDQIDNNHVSLDQNDSESSFENESQTTD
jgi:hypothetical protein